MRPATGAGPPASLDVPGSIQEGIASWYGNPYHGRRTASGEVYDMRKLTAAHQTLPFGTRVKVTNLENRRTTEVRINDRGPFVKGRIIDLSRKAAEDLRMLGPGTAPVRLEVLSPGEKWEGDFTVQVGAFRNRGNAERLKRELDSQFDAVSIQKVPGGLLRVQVGRVSSRAEANQLAQRLRNQRSVDQTLVVEVP